MRYADLVKANKELVIKTEAGTLNVVYNQGFLNRNNSALNADENITKIDYVIKCFCDGLLIKWDLEDEKGKTIPINPKELNKLNMDFLIDLYSKIQDDIGNFFKK